MNDTELDAIPKFDKTGELTMVEVVGWWELRRIVYNLAVGAIGLLSVIAMIRIGSRVVPPGHDFLEPLAIALGSVVFGILANVCYCLGWVVELGVVRGSRSHHEA